MSEHREYFGNVLEAFSVGVQVDFRAKVALELLKSGTSMPAGGTLEERARAAIDLATHFISIAEARGLVRPLPEDNQLDAAFRANLERNVRASALQQLAGQRIMQEEAPQIAGAHMIPAPGRPSRQ